MEHIYRADTRENEFVLEGRRLVVLDEDARRWCGGEVDRLVDLAWCFFGYYEDQETLL